MDGTHAAYDFAENEIPPEIGRKAGQPIKRSRGATLARHPASLQK